MFAMQTKDDIVKLVQDLPASVSLDDVIEELIFVRKVSAGLAEAGQGVSQAEAEAEFRKPRAERAWNRG